jgi:serine/threonine protein kinase
MAAPIVEFPDPADLRETRTRCLHHLVDFTDTPDAKARFTRKGKIAHSYSNDCPVELHTRRQGETEEEVVVKNMRTEVVRRSLERADDEREERSPAVEDAVMDIAVLLYLRSCPPCENVLKMLEYFHEDGNTWLVTERACLGDLFSFVTACSLTERHIFYYFSQLITAVYYLHMCNIGHRDISLENILLTDSHTVKLMDFGQAVICRTSTGRRFRYFCLVGKDPYRAPEIYIERNRDHTINMVRPEGAANEVKQTPSLVQIILPPGAPGVRMDCPLAGYEVEPADLFSLGIVLYTLKYKKFPWKEAKLIEDTFKKAARRGVNQLVADQNMEPLLPGGMDLLGDLLMADPARRASLNDACRLQEEWYRSLEAREAGQGAAAG